MTKKLSNEDWELLRIDYNNGISVSKLAEKYNIGRNSIYVYLRRRNLLKKEVTKSKSNKNKLSIIERIKNYFDV